MPRDRRPNVSLKWTKMARQTQGSHSEEAAGEEGEARGGGQARSQPDEGHENGVRDPPHQPEQVVRDDQDAERRQNDEQVAGQDGGRSETIAGVAAGANSTKPSEGLLEGPSRVGFQDILS